MEPDINAVVAAVMEYDHTLTLFMRNVADFFATHPELTKGTPPAIHSVKSRKKDHDHLREKIIRKVDQESRIITRENVFEEVTDLVGVRVLHLHQDQFLDIHSAIMKSVGPGAWALHEKPKAYTWDPESRAVFESVGIDVEFKESYYTSVHYVIRSNSASPLRCEVQVRTMFEEVWGEVDHAINYPHKTSSVACREQLRVLAKLVATGTRLADAVFRTHKSESEKRQVVSSK